MTQRHLILIVLGFIIGGLAIVVCIQAFKQYEAENNLTAMKVDGLRIGSAAQAWKLRPDVFGGGANRDGFTYLTLDELGFTTETVWVEYGEPVFNRHISQSGTWHVVRRHSNFVFNGCNAEHENGVQVIVSGTSPHDIEVVTGRHEDYCPGR